LDAKETDGGDAGRMLSITWHYALLSMHQKEEGIDSHQGA
jgi:hypothetical protein